MTRRAFFAIIFCILYVSSAFLTKPVVGCTVSEYIASYSYRGKGNLYFSRYLTSLEGLEKIPHRKSIRSISIMHTKLRSIPPESFSRFPNLRYLILADNCLQDVTGLCKGLTHLFQLDLTGNNLKKIPSDLLVGAKDLAVLSLEENYIETLPVDVFEETRKLRMLRLAYNHLHSIPIGTFSPLHEMEKLHVQHNFLPYIKNEFTVPHDLASVDVMYGLQDGYVNYR